MRYIDSVMAQLEHPFAGPMFTRNRTPTIEGEALAKAKGLTKYEIREGIFLYAKNEREAIKRAKKNGLWREGCIIKPTE